MLVMREDCVTIRCTEDENLEISQVRRLMRSYNGDGVRGSDLTILGNL